MRSAEAIDSRPPVVITTTERWAVVADRLGGAYAAEWYRLDDAGTRSVVVFRRR